MLLVIRLFFVKVGKKLQPRRLQTAKVQDTAKISSSPLDNQVNKQNLEIKRVAEPLADIFFNSTKINNSELASKYNDPIPSIEYLASLS